MPGPPPLGLNIDWCINIPYNKQYNSPFSEFPKPQVYHPNCSSYHDVMSNMWSHTLTVFHNPCSGLDSSVREKCPPSARHSWKKWYLEAAEAGHNIVFIYFYCKSHFAWHPEWLWITGCVFTHQFVCWEQVRGNLLLIRIWYSCYARPLFPHPMTMVILGCMWKNVASL